MRTFLSYCAGVLLLCGFTANMNAQNIFSISDYNKSTRSLGMGGVSSAMDANAFSIYDNASKAAFSEKRLEAGFQYSPWAKNLTDGMDRDNLLLNFAGYYSLNASHKLLLGVSHFTLGGNKMFEMDDQGNVIGDELKPKFFTISAGYAGKLSDEWGLGAVLNYSMLNLGVGDKISALSVDLSATRRWNFSSADYLDISARAAGWGGALSQGSDYKLPGYLTVSGLYNKSFQEKHTLRTGVDLGVRCLNESTFKASAGLEYIFNETLFLRGGYSFNSTDNEENGFASFGAGLRVFKTVQVDASYLLAGDESPLKNTFMVGLNVMF